MAINTPNDIRSLLMQNEGVKLNCIVKFPTEYPVEECYFTDKRILKRGYTNSKNYGKGYASICYRHIQGVSIRYYQNYSTLTIHMTGEDSYSFNFDSEDAFQAHQYVLGKIL